MKLLVKMLAIFLLSFSTPFLIAKERRFLVTDKFGGTWHDANKISFDMDSDMCWAYAAANALAWSDWNQTTIGSYSAQQIGDSLRVNFKNVGGQPVVAMKWWFGDWTSNETDSKRKRSVIGAKIANGPNEERLFRTYDFRDIARDKDLIERLLKEGNALVSIWAGRSIPHANNIWGYTKDENGEIDGFLMTENSDELLDDPTQRELLRVKVRFKPNVVVGNWWKMEDPKYPDYHLYKLQVLVRRDEWKKRHPELFGLPPKVVKSPYKSLSSYKLGQKVEVVWKERWYKAKVIQIKNKDQRYKIHYLGWDKKWDEWVGLDRIRIKPLNPP